ncbi:MAG TPA: bifunctional YncE family protein/alkaline phosphatase family protein [Thermoanaerobaculia bacterium]|jgi:DNA-binding beta-propeller fold protein YncE|nr:bifunctional YncE family protein/alkaline phosphatase family protein [Thermoanaerobaculia bacterium]
MKSAILLLCAALSAHAQFTTPLATGVRLDPAGASVDLGSMPLGMALAPGGARLAVVLSGWREQGLQIVDLKTRSVTQTITQDAAFYGVAFAPDGAHLYVSGGNDDSIYCYTWKDGAAALERKIVLGKQKEDKTGSRYPAGLAVSKNGRYLYVAENVGDALAVVDLSTSDIERLPTDHYPYAVEVAADGNVYVSAWGGDTISIFYARANGTLFAKSRLQVGRHPSALLTNKSGSRLFVALAGSDRVAMIDTRSRRIVRMLSDAAPGGPAEGSTPNALALDETRLYVAEGDNNAVAVFDLATGKLSGRIPTDWYPTAVIGAGHELLVLNGKGHGSHANVNPAGPTPGLGIQRPLGYDLGQLNGTLRIIANASGNASLADYSRRVNAANNWNVARSTRRYPPFKHVIYIIKENRTYDQLFGDLPEGDGDPSLVFFDRTSTPNHRALARRFGLFDRFFTNAEVSSQGHIWSTAAYVTDYGEKTVPSMYANRRAAVDGEEIDEPERGFLWTLAKKAGRSFRDYGEMVSGPEGWPKTQADLGSDISPTYSPFNVQIPDQKRADAWIEEHRHFVEDGNMPALEVMHLPSDHTAGGNPKFHSPRAYMADNDLALGRIVEALTKSPYWRDTVVFVLEDDSQAGPDHVDSHRGPLLVISAYNRPGTIHRFANTTDVVAAIEDILGLDRLSKYDYFSRSLADIFAATPDLTPYAALTPEQSLEEMNPAKTAASRLSEGLDFSAPDRVDDALFNQILWLMMKGDRPMPAAQSRASLHLMQISR